MDFIKNIKAARDTMLAKDVDFLIFQDKARERNNSFIPYYPVWFFSPVKGIPRLINITELRQFSESVWVQMVKRSIKNSISQTTWDVIPAETEESETEDEYEEEIEYTKYFFQHPNRDPEFCFSDLTDYIVDDCFDIDAHIWYLNQMPGGPLLEILPFDGSSFLKENDEHGFLMKWWQFSYKNPLRAPTPYNKDNILYFQMSKRSYTPYGFSPLQAVQQVVEVLDQATRYNKDFFLNNAIPAIIMNLPNANKESLDKFKSNYREQFEGKAHRVMTTNAEDLKIEMLNVSNKDMQWLDGMKWYMHLVFGVAGLSPAEAGFYEDVNRASQEGQERISAKNAVLPWLAMIEKKANYLIPRILGEQDKPIKERTPIVFKFFPKDSGQEQMDHAAQIEDVQNKIRSVNEIRAEKGLKPFEAPEADNPFLMQEQGGFGNENNLQGNNKAGNDKANKPGNRGNPRYQEEDEEEDVEKKLSGQEDEWYEGKDYSEFLDKMFNKWEDRVTNKVGAIDKSFNLEKGMGDFLKGMFEGMTILEFYNVIKRVVKNTMLKGHNEVEEDLDHNIAISDVFSKKATGYAEQQYTGYTLPDGKKWPGLKGVAHDVQMDVLREIETGLKNKETNEELKERVKKVFKGVKDGRALTIAKTESARFTNEGRLEAMRTFQNDTGIKINKRWVTFQDDRTCPVCKSLDGQEVNVTDVFKSHGKAFNAPPCSTHPNCRCYIKSVRA